VPQASKEILEYIVISEPKGKGRRTEEQLAWEALGKLS